MKLILLIIFLISAQADRRIVSRPIRSTYDQYGHVKQLIIEWKSVQPIFKGDYLKIVLPEPIHNSLLTVDFEIFTAYSRRVTETEKSESYVSDNTYFLRVNIFMEAKVWYEVRIKVENVVTKIYGLVGIGSVSSTSSSSVKYAWNYGFEYFHLETTSLPNNQTLLISFFNHASTLSAESTMILVEVESLVTIEKELKLTLALVDFIPGTVDLDSSTVFDEDGNGFIFVGSCYARCDSSDSLHTCIHHEECEVTLTSITVTLPYMKMGEKYLIEAYVLNPPYVSKVGLQGYLGEENGQVTSISFTDTLLEVLPIQIYQEESKLFWGIPQSIAVNEMGLGLYLNDPASKHQSLSTFDIGFSLHDSVPIESQFEVRVFVGATNLLIESISHNLPVYRRYNHIHCIYEDMFIVCKNVGAFSNQSFRYYIRARANFLTTDDITNFGLVTIKLSQYPDQELFLTFPPTPPPTLLNSDYHDYGGLHESTSFKIHETLITSHTDTLLLNSTSNSIKDFMNGSSFVGIDPLSSPLQLLFFLKVGVSSMSLPSETVQKYTLKIFTNPNVMNSSNLGIDFVGYSALDNTWDVEKLPCYVDSSTSPTIQNYSCQKYNDHVYNEQIDNKFIKSSNYGVYEWVCGNGEKVTCPTSDCSTQCAILKGGFSSSMTDGSAGVLSIRNVTFPKNYHSPIEAGTQNLDFIIAFYQNDILVTSSLINAYTVNKTRLQKVRADVVNYYIDSSNKNEGDRFPTFLKISGLLTIQEIGSNEISALRIYFPSVLNMNNFIESENKSKIGCSTKNCSAFTGGLALSQDNWLQQNGVVINSLPSLTESFTILIPVVFEKIENLFQVTLKLELKNGSVRGIFRINGSSISESLLGSHEWVTKPESFNNWTPSSLEWVSNPSFTFKQSFDLSTITPYVASSTINMGATVMQNNDSSPSITFVTKSLNIFSNSSIGQVDMITFCLGPFSYFYKNIDQIWALWCPVKIGNFNTIKISYPYYPDVLGAGFPFSLIFTYTYSSSNGSLQGYRIEQASGVNINNCSVQKTTTYDKNSNSPQTNEFVIKMAIPFTLSPTKNKFKISFTFPTTISMELFACECEENHQKIIFDCAPQPIVGDPFAIELGYSGENTIKVWELKILLKTIKTLPATITSIQQFFVNIYLPISDGTIPILTGNSFIPFQTKISTCSNSFTYSDISSIETITLTKGQLNSVGAKYYGSLSFTTSFSSSRTVFFAGSSLVLTFSQPILSEYSRCSLYPNSHIFSEFSISPSLQILTLTTAKETLDFTLVTYIINCTSIKIPETDFTIILTWAFETFIIQSTALPILIKNPWVGTVVGEPGVWLVEKKYNSGGYLGEYEVTVNLGTSGEICEIYGHFGDISLHKTFLECEYQNGTAWVQVLCFVRSTDVESEIYVKFMTTTQTSLRLKIYGIPQERKAQTITMLVKLTLSTSSMTTYSIISIPDIDPIEVTNAPIKIYSLQVFPSSINISYSLPIDHSSLFFIEIDELFSMDYLSKPICNINNTLINCSRVRPNLIEIENTLPHITNYISFLTISELSYFPTEIYDQQQINFYIFIPNNNKDTVLYGSHSHYAEEIFTLDTHFPEALIWNVENSWMEDKGQIVYVGYYGAGARLETTEFSTFKDSFKLEQINNISLWVEDGFVEFGFDHELVYFGATDSTELGLHSLQFNQTSPYPLIPNLLLFIENVKCILQTEFLEYSIVPGGVTIPISINMQKCRPMSNLTLHLAISSTSLTIDTTLTTKTISSENDYAYIVVGLPGTANQNQLFQLQINLTSSVSYVQSSYESVNNVTIRVGDRNLLIGNPEGKQPLLMKLSKEEVIIEVRCNTPATIYWGVGVYPTMLGVTFEQIQARLVEKGNGLVDKQWDVYSWSQEIYGLSYTHDFNVDKNISIYGLKGGLDYVFKYYCIDQTGKASGGKILSFLTQPTNYSLMKITLAFVSQLNYFQVNSLACAISETLKIPYYQTITSVHSNCINNTEVYHNFSDSFFDGNSGDFYFYQFYVESQIVEVNSIVSILNAGGGLGSNRAFLSASLPYYTSMRADPLSNVEEPQIMSHEISTFFTNLTIRVNVGLNNAYLIAALMEKPFDPITMSLPTHYLMKEGYFSLGTKFNQISSVYGSQKIDATFIELSPGKTYTVFFFTTVDNSALNSRTSKVNYKVVSTMEKILVDLFDVLNTGCFCILIVMILGTGF